MRTTVVGSSFSCISRIVGTASLTRRLQRLTISVVIFISFVRRAGDSNTSTLLLFRGCARMASAFSSRFSDAINYN